MDSNAKIAICLSIYNGEAFLKDQLTALTKQSYKNWHLHWRDDGSTDSSLEIMNDYAATLDGDRHTQYEQRHLKPTMSFMVLLKEAVKTDATLFAFCDQDDIWFVDKLERGVIAIAKDNTKPLLYCSSHTIVDEKLKIIGMSPKVKQSTKFPAALTQNIAQGCTIILNRKAAEAIASSVCPTITWHDWWCYLVVTALEGEVIYDTSPSLLYRQHKKNQVGDPGSMLSRAIGAFKRGRAPFMNLLTQHIEYLDSQPFLLTDHTKRVLDMIKLSLKSGFLARLDVLSMPNFRRQTFSENFIFRLWFLTY